MTSAQLIPRKLAETEGQAYWFLNNLSVIKATSASTGGKFSLTWSRSWPGHATPYHLHHVEDEAFWIIEGEFTFICDGAKMVAGPGGYVFLPHGIPHGVRASSSMPATMLILATPGDGFQGLMMEMENLRPSCCCLRPSRPTRRS